LEDYLEEILIVKGTVGLYVFNQPLLPFTSKVVVWVYGRKQE